MKKPHLTWISTEMSDLDEWRLGGLLVVECLAPKDCIKTADVWRNTHHTPGMGRPAAL